MSADFRWYRAEEKLQGSVRALAEWRFERSIDHYDEGRTLTDEQLDILELQTQALLEAVHTITGLIPPTAEVNDGV